jgi:molecular chaperone GrpE
MMDAAARERLVEQFRACLDEAAQELPDGGGELDLHSLLAEMAALKNEVRLQARHFKTALEQMHTFSEALREHNERLLRDLERSRSQAADARAQAERGLLLGLLELRDRLQAGLVSQQAWRPSPIQRLLGGEPRLARSMLEGSTLLLQRLDDLLSTHRVRPITALGQPLDPHCMQAVAVEWAPAVAEGIVLRELRCGFVQGAELLRAAEVIVNKKG